MELESIPRVANAVELIVTMQQDPCLRGQTLESLLIMPVQRVPRYALLLREILARTPHDHVDYADTLQALADVTEVAGQINAAIARHQRQASLVGLQNRISPPPSPSLVTPSRVLLREGRLLKMSRRRAFQPYHVALLNDAFLYGDAEDASEEPRVRLHQMCTLTGVVDPNPHDYGSASVATGGEPADPRVRKSVRGKGGGRGGTGNHVIATPPRRMSHTTTQHRLRTAASTRDVTLHRTAPTSRRHGTRDAALHRTLRTSRHDTRDVTLCRNAQFSHRGCHGGVPPPLPLLYTPCSQWRIPAAVLASHPHMLVLVGVPKTIALDAGDATTKAAWLVDARQALMEQESRRRSRGSGDLDTEATGAALTLFHSHDTSAVCAECGAAFSLLRGRAVCSNCARMVCSACATTIKDADALHRLFGAGGTVASPPGGGDGVRGRSSHSGVMVCKRCESQPAAGRPRSTRMSGGSESAPPPMAVDAESVTPTRTSSRLPTPGLAGTLPRHASHADESGVLAVGSAGRPLPRLPDDAVTATDSVDLRDMVGLMEGGTAEGTSAEGLAVASTGPIEDATLAVASPSPSRQPPMQPPSGGAVPAAADQVKTSGRPAPSRQLDDTPAMSLAQWDELAQQLVDDMRARHRGTHPSGSPTARGAGGIGPPSASISSSQPAPAVRITASIGRTAESHSQGQPSAASDSPSATDTPPPGHRGGSHGEAGPGSPLTSLAEHVPARQAPRPRDGALDAAAHHDPQYPVARGGAHVSLKRPMSPLRVTAAPSSFAAPMHGKPQPTAVGLSRQQVAERAVPSPSPSPRVRPDRPVAVAPMGSVTDVTAAMPPPSSRGRAAAPASADHHPAATASATATLPPFAAGGAATLQMPPSLAPRQPTIPSPSGGAVTAAMPLPSARGRAALSMYPDHDPVATASATAQPSPPAPAAGARLHHPTTERGTRTSASRQPNQPAGRGPSGSGIPVGAHATAFVAQLEAHLQGSPAPSSANPATTTHRPPALHTEPAATPARAASGRGRLPTSPMASPPPTPFSIAFRGAHPRLSGLSVERGAVTAECGCAVPVRDVSGAGRGASGGVVEHSLVQHEWGSQGWRRSRVRMDAAAGEAAATKAPLASHRAPHRATRTQQTDAEDGLPGEGERSPEWLPAVSPPSSRHRGHEGLPHPWSVGGRGVHDAGADARPAPRTFPTADGWRDLAPVAAPPRQPPQVAGFYPSRASGAALQAGMPAIPAGAWMAVPQPTGWYAVAPAVVPPAVWYATTAGGRPHGGVVPFGAVPTTITGLPARAGGGVGEARGGVAKDPFEELMAGQWEGGWEGEGKGRR